MDKEEIIKRLEQLAGHAVHVIGEPPSVMSIDDGIALVDAVFLLRKQEEQESVIEALKSDLNETLSVLGEQPDIVRCKDCKYCEYPEAEKEWCKKGHLHGNAKNWFCADGERR